MNQTEHIHKLIDAIHHLEREANKSGRLTRGMQQALDHARITVRNAEEWGKRSATVQGELFTSTPPAGLIPTGRADTSLGAAAFQAKSGKATSDRGRILHALARSASTTDSLEARLSMSHQTCSARVHGLNKDGLIADSTRRQRTRAGRQAIVWEVTPKGREALRGQG